MDESALQASYALDSVSKVLAEWTVARHAEQDPALLSAAEPTRRAEWVADVQVRLAALAQAVAVRRPALFVDAVDRSRASQLARGLAADDLRQSLAAMQEVMEEQLPPAVVEHTTQPLLAAKARLESDAVAPRAELDAHASHGRLAAKYLAMLLDGRGREGVQMIVDAANSGISVGDLYEHVLLPVQAELGRMWQANEITVADEHFVTASTQQVMARLRAFFPPSEPCGHAVIATSVAGDIHDLGLRMVADHFEMAGWDVIFLGANTPTRDVLEMAGRGRARLLAISASTALHVRSVGELIAALRAAPNGASIRVVVGGGPFVLVPDLWQEIGADGTVSRAADAPDLGARLIA